VSDFNRHGVDAVIVEVFAMRRHGNPSASISPKKLTLRIPEIPAIFS